MNYIYLIIALGMFLFKVTAPSNKVNIASHITKYDIDFQMLDIIDKFYNGFWTTSEHFFYHFNLVSFLMAGSIAIGIIIIIRKDFFYSVLGMIPPFFVGFIPLIVSIPSSFSQIRSERYSDGINLSNFQRMGSYVPFAIYILIFILICINIYILYGYNASKRWIACT